MPTERLPKPATGTRIDFKNGKIVVPDDPIIPFIEGDGTGPDIWRATQIVLDGAVKKVYGGKKKFAWYEVYAGDKATAEPEAIEESPRKRRSRKGQAKEAAVVEVAEETPAVEPEAAEEVAKVGHLATQRFHLGLEHRFVFDVEVAQLLFGVQGLGFVGRSPR